MPASEQRRLALRNRLIEVLGEEEAEALMESLPPFDWHRLATKDDVFALKGDIEASEQRIRAEMNGKFVEIEGKFVEMDGKFARVEGEFAKVHAEFTKLRGENKEFRGEMALQFARQTRTMVFTILGVSLPTWGAILAMGLG